jgi:hypothetical protein
MLTVRALASIAITLRTRRVRILRLTWAARALSTGLSASALRGDVAEPDIDCGTATDRSPAGVFRAVHSANSVKWHTFCKERFWQPGCFPTLRLITHPGGGPPRCPLRDPENFEGPHMLRTLLFHLQHALSAVELARRPYHATGSTVTWRQRVSTSPAFRAAIRNSASGLIPRVDWRGAGVGAALSLRPAI